MMMDYFTGVAFGIVVGYVGAVITAAIYFAGWLMRIEYKIDQCMKVVDREATLEEVDESVPAPSPIIRKNRTMWD